MKVTYGGLFAPDEIITQMHVLQCTMASAAGAAAPAD
jgi:hypothetical protein